MTNLTLDIDETLLRHVDAKRRRFEALDALDAVAARSQLSSEAKWLRDDLHQRKKSGYSLIPICGYIE